MGPSINYVGSLPPEGGLAKNVFLPTRGRGALEKTYIGIFFSFSGKLIKNSLKTLTLHIRFSIVAMQSQCTTQKKGVIRSKFCLFTEKCPLYTLF